MKKISYIITGVMLCIMTSCKKFVELDSPRNQLTSDKVFADSTNADGAIIGIYYTFMSGQNIVSSSSTIYKALAADELTTTQTDAQQEFLSNNITTGNSFNNGLWSGAYKSIYQVNAAIEGVAGSKGITLNAKSRFIAELSCIRAYLYYQLLYLYGGVPLILEADFENNSRLPRASEDAVAGQIIKDLQVAQSGLPKDNFVRSRANYYAATALLAKTYLLQKDYASAIIEANKVISAGNFSLQTDLTKVFTADSPEGIWTLVPVFPGRETWEGFSFVPTSTSVRPRYTITPQLFNAFQGIDKRRTAWINSNTISGQTYNYPYKYRKATGSGTPVEHYQLLRLAEVYLVLADAEIGANKISDGLTHLNAVRRRAGLSDFSSNSSVDINNEILHQRQLELFCEQGARWNDLRRTNRIDAVLGPLKSGWTPTDKYFPIPQSEIRANAQLTQNPGY